MFQVDDKVVRTTLYRGDYTNGREGTVVEVDDINNRARVRWETEINRLGKVMPLFKPLRTWVKFNGISHVRN